MGDNGLEALERLDREGDLSPEVRSQLRARIAELKGPPQGAPAMRPSPVLGPFAPQPVQAPPSTRLRDMPSKILATAPAKASRTLPEEYTPTKPNTGMFVPDIYHTEPSGATPDQADEAWRQTMSRAEKTGQTAHRVSQQYPVGLGDLVEAGPLGAAKNLGVRFQTDVLGPAVRGLDTATGHLASNLVLRGLDKLAGIPGAYSQQREQWAESSPVSSFAGSVGAGFVRGGLPARIGGAAQKLAPAALASTPMRRIVGSGLTNALAGGATSAADAAIGKAFGENRDVLSEAKSGAVAGGGAGLFFGGLGELGRNRQEALRDPRRNSPQAEDVNLAETAGGETSVVSGMRAKPGSEFDKALDDLSGRSRVKGQGMDALAADDAAQSLGTTLGEYHGETLGAAKAANAAAPQGTVSAEPLVRKNLELLRKSTHADGAELPGHDIAGIAEELGRSADVLVVDATSPEAHAVADDFVMPLGMAKKLGLVRGSGGDFGKVVVLQPKQFNAEQLDDINRMYQQSAKLLVHDPRLSPKKGLVAGGLETRAGFGQAWEQAKAEQAKALNEMKNALEASGLPRDASKVDMGDVGTENALYGAVRGYKAGRSVPYDREIDRVAQRSPELRQKLDQAAAVGALQRLKAQATPNPSLRGNMEMINPYGRLGGFKLRLDPVMGAFAHMGEKFPGLIPAASAEGARRAGKRGTK